MLVLSRKTLQTVVIDGRIVVKVLGVKGKTIRLGFEAPTETSIRRGELPETQPNATEPNRTEPNGTE